MREDAGGWLPYDHGASLGDTGSEGVILRDEEYGGGARITLERDGFAAPFSITCGVYGWLVHTRFFAHGWEAERQYVAMKPGLAAIVDLMPPAGESPVGAKMDPAVDAINRFMERFP
jgi:hypothetical protein